MCDEPLHPSRAGSQSLRPIGTTSDTRAPLGLGPQVRLPEAEARAVVSEGQGTRQKGTEPRLPAIQPPAGSPQGRAVLPLAGGLLLCFLLEQEVQVLAVGEPWCVLATG